LPEAILFHEYYANDAARHCNKHVVYFILLWHLSYLIVHVQTSLTHTVWRMCWFARTVWCIWWESGQSHWLQGDGVWHIGMLSWSDGGETQV